MDEQAKKKFLITTAYIVTVGAIVFIVCRFLLKYLMPFILGGLIAWAVQKPAYYISGKTRLNPKISAAALTIAVFAVLALQSKLQPDTVMTIVTMVVAFYFGTQTESKQNKKDE